MSQNLMRLILVLCSLGLLLETNFVVVYADEDSLLPMEMTTYCCDSSAEDIPSDVQIKSLSLKVKASEADLEDYGTPAHPQISVCMSHKQFTHNFTVSPGHKFTRLHFCLASYPGLNVSDALFSVSVGQYTLLRTSQSSYSRDSSDIKCVIREFVMKVDAQILSITFTPSSGHSKAYAFVNKIEIITMPANVYMQDVRLPLVGNSSQIYAVNYTVLETMHRVNVGGDDIPPEGDARMWRSWSGDEDYFVPDGALTSILQSKLGIKYSPEVPAYTAPEKVYSTARTLSPKSGGNMSWSFLVNSGFCYLVRLHFCEITREIRQNGRVFKVYINNMTAGIVRWSRMPGRPVYRDYIIDCSELDTGMEDLQITISSDNGPSESDCQGILNGLEIFKLPDSRDNLAGLNPFGTATSHGSPYREDKATRISLSIFYGLFAVVFLFSFTLLYIPSEWYGTFSLCQKRSSKCCKPFGENAIPLTKIMSTTNNFSDDALIGTGGFGKVYRGSLDGGATLVAVKRADPSSHQGLHEFQTEISMLSKLRHHHLVTLMGYCLERKEMILIYNFMGRGTLREHLYKTNSPPLPLKKRLEICIGAARGLHYLHTGWKQIVIHRDVKSSNILLDDKWEAKVSDFGLSKLGPDAMNQSDMQVSTAVKGSIGYLDPEYYRRLKLTAKSDVYSFGVVLFEVLCAKPAILPAHGNGDGPQSLAECALKCYHSGMLGQMIDPYLQGKIDPDCFRTFTDVAVKCLAETGRERPSMGYVLWNLELALQQQSRADGEKLRGPADKILAGNSSILVAHQLYNSDKNIGAEFSEIIHQTAR
ncbi:receptor-like protein kinase FERONIA [Eucalyptus grandis]|uniref:receptor-like protein kinase FERONIA n=1 Tax=Eucalyptus grandis TaxID=71139 RepID=UPI00192E7FE5|nr:receptor-like protein kinase FERONIA [Eucalyptus grandis]